MSITREFDLIINAGTSSPLVINANQNDSGETWLFNLYQEDGTKVTPLAGQIVGLKTDGHAIVNAGTVNGSGQVVITETAQITACPGSNIFELVFDSVHGTANFILLVEKSPVDDDADFSESDISAINQAITMAIDSATVQAVQNGLAAETAARTSADNLLQTEIDQIIAPSGEAPSAAEVTNARIGADGTVYDTLGNAIRGQVSDLNKELNDSNTDSYDLTERSYYSKEDGKRIASDGTLVNDANYEVQMFPVQNHREKLFKIQSDDKFCITTSNTLYPQNIIGHVYGTGTYWIAVPSNANRLWISTPKTGSTAKVYSTTKKKINSSNIENNAVTNEKILDGAVTEKKTDFLKTEPGTNLFDFGNVQTEKWYYVANSINTISLTPTTAMGYQSVLTEISDTNEKLTYSIDESSAVFYNYYFVDGSGNILSRGGNGTALSLSGTFDIPSGSQYLLMSIRLAGSFTLDKKVRINYGTEIAPYEDYTKNIFIDDYELAKKSYVNEQVNILQDEIDAINPNVSLLKLPSKIDIVAGYDFEFFYKGLCNAVDSDEYEFDVEINPRLGNDKNWARKYTASPNQLAIGTHVATVTVRNNGGQIIDSGSFNIVVHAAPSEPASEKVVLCIGDSLTTGGGWPKELRRLLIGSGGTPSGLELNNINFIGTKSLSDGTRFEGYGGWTFTSYSTENKNNDAMWITCVAHPNVDQWAIYQDGNGSKWKLETIEEDQIKIIRTSSDSNVLPASGTLTYVEGGTHANNIVYTASEQAPGNPFWNQSLNRNDFKTYASQFGVNHIDHCIILLGWNSTGTNETYYKGITRTFLDSLLDPTYGFPNCKITLVGLQVPSRNGMGENFAPGWYFYPKLQHVWNLQKWYQELLTEYTTADYVCLSAQFDTEYNCITSNLPVNLRNSEQVKIQTNAVHPGPSGYLEIADAVFRNLCSRL